MRKVPILFYLILTVYFHLSAAVWSEPVPRKIEIRLTPESSSEPFFLFCFESLKSAVAEKAGTELVPENGDCRIELTFLRTGASGEMEVFYMDLDNPEKNTGTSHSLVLSSASFMDKTMPLVIQTVNRLFPPRAQQIREEIVESTIEEVEILPYKGAVTVTLKADPGTIITIKGRDKAEVPELGYVEIPDVPENSTFQFRAEKAGHMPNNYSPFVGTEDVEFTVFLEEIRRWAAGLNLAFTSTLSLHPVLSYIPGEGRQRIFIVLDQNILNSLDNPEMLAYFAPTLGYQYGFNPPESKSQFYIGIDVSSRIDFVPDNTTLSRYERLIIRPFAAYETRLVHHLFFYISYGPRIYFGPDMTETVGEESDELFYGIYYRDQFDNSLSTSIPIASGKGRMAWVFPICLGLRFYF